MKQWLQCPDNPAAIETDEQAGSDGTPAEGGQNKIKLKPIFHFYISYRYIVSNIRELEPDFFLNTLVYVYFSSKNYDKYKESELAWI